MFAPKNILVPTDFSEHSDRALAEAVDIARRHKARIYLLHVLGVVRQCVSDYCMPADLLEDVRADRSDRHRPHGQTGMLHHLMGGVSDKVTRSAECPVYLVRGPNPA